MAKNRSNLITQGLTGTLGPSLAFRSLADGRTILCTRPDFSRRHLSPAQELHHRRFRQAATYARAAARSQPAYAQQAALTPLRNAYNLALADWFHPPVIHTLERLVGHIFVRATDDFLVAGLTVTVFSPTGDLLETGQARSVDGCLWEYAPAASLEPGCRILAEARDLPGTLASADLHL
jgi:hypothetical protein